MGVYDYNASATSQPNYLIKFAPDMANNTGLLTGASLDLTEHTLVSDVLYINQDTSLLDFPIDVNLASASRRNMLGVGISSATLSYLKRSTKIKSSVWSYWDGLYGLADSDNMDGPVVFGGYDLAKISGPAFTCTQSNLIKVV